MHSEFFARFSVTISLGIAILTTLPLDAAFARSLQSGAGPQFAIQPTQPNLANKGYFPNEEKFVRDVYARLMRYDMAARDYYAAEDPNSHADSAYLVIRLQNLHTDSIRTLGDLSGFFSSEGIEPLSLERRFLRRGNDPEHVFYEVSWAPEKGKHLGRNSPSVSLADVDRYTAYDVIVELAGKVQRYKAMVLYHVLPARDGLVTPEFIDPAFPDIQQVAGEHSPLVKQPWDKYVKTLRYRQIVRLIEERQWKGQSAIPPGAAIGYLPGDEIGVIETMSEHVPCDGCNYPRDLTAANKITDERTLTIQWTYTSSSGGDITDLAGCEIKEVLSHSENPVQPPFPDNPWAPESTWGELGAPWKKWMGMSDKGYIEDAHTTPGPFRLRSPEEDNGRNVTTTQSFRYVCPCGSGLLTEAPDIVRMVTVEPYGPPVYAWYFSIWQGSFAINPVRIWP
jgi:hypothetical protein